MAFFYSKGIEFVESGPACRLYTLGGDAQITTSLRHIVKLCITEADNGVAFYLERGYSLVMGNGILTKTDLERLDPEQEHEFTLITRI
jgi:hypothetical protein